VSPRREFLRVSDGTRNVPLREKDTGTKLEALYAAYAAASPPVHAKVLGQVHVR
jgi:hypothetical protein